MNKPVRQTEPAPPALPDPGVLMVGPLTAMRLWADLHRTMSSVMPASLLIATSPFFWAPPLWVGALMSARAATPHGGAEGSTAVRREAAAAKHSVAPPSPPAPPPRRAAHPRGRRVGDS